MTEFVNVVERTPLLAAVEERLEGWNGVVYLGEAGTVPQVENDKAGRVAVYGVLTPLLGSANAEDSVAADQVGLDWGFDFRVASGFVNDTLAAAEEADELLHRWTPVLDPDLGYVAGKLRPPPGYDASLLVDLNESPHRFYVPLQYGTTITAT